MTRTSDEAPPLGLRIGTWIKLPAVESVEICVAAGFEFAIVDLEHGLIPDFVLSAMLAVARAARFDLFVRVPRYSDARLATVLDHGAAGVVIPNIETPEQAAAAVASVRFPPHGSRGVSVSGRAGSWGEVGVRTYMAAQNASVALYLQIESRLGVANAREIAATEGLDGLIVGPADLSADVVGTEWEGRERALLSQVERACALAGVMLGTAAGVDATQAKDLVGRGYRLLAVSSDVGLLRAAGKALLDSLADARANGASDVPPRSILG